MATTAKDWIKQRLPADAEFSKNGITTSVDNAIDAALADYDDDSDFSQRRLALADLLDVLAANVEFEEERLGDWTGKKQILSDRATALRGESASGNTSPGTFGFTPATFNNAAPTDEYSS